MIEILCNGVVHYRRPSMDDPDVQEALSLIKWHERLAGGKSSYEVREVTYRITHLAGQCRSGSDTRGHVTHLVSGWRAACGKEPGRHSAGWSEYNDTELTCPKCKRLADVSNISPDETLPAQTVTKGI